VGHRGTIDIRCTISDNRLSDPAILHVHIDTRQSKSDYHDAAPGHISCLHLYRTFGKSDYRDAVLGKTCRVHIDIRQLISDNRDAVLEYTTCMQQSVPDIICPTIVYHSLATRGSHDAPHVFCSRSSFICVCIANLECNCQMP